MNSGPTDAQKAAEKAARQQQSEQAALDANAKAQLLRQQQEDARRGAGVQAFVRTGDTGTSGSAPLLRNVLGV